MTQTDTAIDTRFVADRAGVTPGTPADTVLRFLAAMAHGDQEATLELIDDDLVYENVSLPTIRGRQRFEAGLRNFVRYGLSFEVAVHRVAEHGSTVLTERTDAIIIGPYRAQFWVCGVFEVVDGRVVGWRDYFDWVNVILGSLRGVLGMVVPALKARF